MKKKIWTGLAAILAALFLTTIMARAEAAPVGAGRRILYIPIDTRPITSRMSSEVAEKLGYEVQSPPETLLGDWQRTGDPEGLWRWLSENAPGARAAVVSSDAMLYGSLVHSRRHGFSEQEVKERAQRFQALHERFPRLPIYVYGTVMRTPSSASHSGGYDAPIIQQYGEQIYRYTILKDKEELGELSGREKKELTRLTKEIPSEALDGWMARRKVNYNANACLVDLARQNCLSYLLLAGDDGAIRSQTHYEGRHLREYGTDLGKTRFFVMSGADELGMLMLCRAVNDDLRNMPFLYVSYNEGMGAETIPTYSNEKIGFDIDGAITAAGGLKILSPERASLVLAVNTNPDGKTPEANGPKNTKRPRNGTKPFMAMVKDFLAKGFPVGVGDIAFGNGSDNALMEQLRKENLQFSLRAYGGWNTASNTMGFLIGSGILTQWMDKKDAEDIMITRYLDEWAYQANVRQSIAGAFFSGGTPDIDAANRALTQQIAAFAEKNLRLPPGRSLSHLKVTLPWRRSFECSPTF